MTISKRLAVHLTNTVYLVEKELKIFLVNIPPPVPTQTNTDVKKKKFTLWLNTEVRF